MLKNMDIVTKVMFAFALAFLFFVLMATKSFLTVSGIIAKHKEMDRFNNISEKLVHREKEHLAGVNKVLASIVDGSVSTVPITKDPHACKMGKFLYSDERKNLEETIPELKTTFSNMERQHKDFHNSVKELENLMQSGEISFTELWNYYQKHTICEFA